jgi:hypothetical protein
MDSAVILRASDFGEESGTVVLRDGKRRHVFAGFVREAGGRKRSPALGDGALEKSPGQRRRRQHADRDSTGRFAKNCDAIRISAKRGDVAIYPLQSGDLIEHAVVARVAVIFRA